MRHPPLRVDCAATRTQRNRVSLLSLHLSSLNTYLSCPSQVARRSLAGVPWAAPLFFQSNNAHSEKVCSSPMEKGGARPGGSLIH